MLRYFSHLATPKLIILDYYVLLDNGEAYSEKRSSKVLFKKKNQKL